MTYRDTARFYRQLAATSRAGLPIGSALRIVANEGDNRRVKRHLEGIADTLSLGAKISDAARACPKIFDILQRATIAASEATGRIDIACDELAQSAERSALLQDALRRELLLPKITLVCSIPFLFLFLPAYNNSRVGIGCVAVLLLLALFGTVVLLQNLLLRAQSQQGSNWDIFVFRMPIVGKIALNLSLARFARSFGILYRTGMGACESLSLAAKACGNAIIAQKLHRAIPYIDHGWEIERAFETIGLFSPGTLGMIAIGDFAGNLDSLMDCIANQYEQELDLQLHQAAISLGVSALLIVGTLVGLICIRFYTSVRI